MRLKSGVVEVPKATAFCRTKNGKIFNAVVLGQRLSLSLLPGRKVVTYTHLTIAPRLWQLFFAFFYACSNALSIQANAET
jgi:hypothetical protein